MLVALYSLSYDLVRITIHLQNDDLKDRERRRRKESSNKAKLKYKKCKKGSRHRDMCNPNFNFFIQMFLFNTT